MKPQIQGPEAPRGPNPRKAVFPRAGTVGVALLVVLTGCMGLGATDPTQTSRPDSGPKNVSEGPPWTGTSFTWTTDGDHTYFAISVEVESRTDYEREFSNNASWNDTRGYLTTGQRLYKGLNHTARIAGAAFTQGDTCSEGDTDGRPTEPEDCPTQDWTNQGAWTVEGFLKPGRYVIFQAAFGADRANLTMSLRTENPVTVHWIDRGHTRLVELRDRDRTFTYPQGEVQHNANATFATDDPYFGVFSWTGYYRMRPDYEIHAPGGEYSFTRRHPQPGFWDHEFRVHMYAEYSARAGTTQVFANGGLRATDGAGFPMLGILEDPAFVDDQGLMKDLG